MVNHTKAFYIKQKEKEIQEKLRLEEKRLLKESAYKRRLKRQREKYKAMKNANGAEYQSYLEYQKEYQRIYGEQYRLKKAKDREERVIAFLGERNWRKIKFEGQKYSHYVVDDGHIYKKNGKEVGSVTSNGYVITSFGYMHKIIWEAFKGKIPEGYEIDHINTIRNDNRLENLRLVTHKENCNNPLSIEHYKQHNKSVDRTYLKNIDRPYLKNIDRSYLTKYYDIVQMDLENNIIAKYKTTKDLPSKYDKTMIYKAIKGKLKNAYGYIWKAKIKK